MTGSGWFRAEPAMAPTDQRWKPFAWCGIRLDIPADWETSQLALDYGLLEVDHRPALEFKTARLKRRCAPARLMRLLRQHAPNRRRLQLKPIALPQNWQAGLAGFETQAFAWQGPQLSGCGLTIYCPTCRRATLLQFFEGAGRAPIPVAPILASLRDHGQDQGPNVAVYDIRACVPPDLPLQSFTFAIGHFELIFGHRRARTTLWRWSPADIALSHSGGTLPQFAARNHLLPGKPPAPEPRATPGGCEWRWPAAAASWPRPLFFRMTPRALRLWHLPHANRLLAVRAEGGVATETFEAICDGYRVL